MRAARIHAYGDASQFRVEDAPDPVAGDGDVLIRVVASSVNPIDFKMRGGVLRRGAPRKMPTILGMDVSGVVEQVGAGVTRFRVGDAVYSSPSHKRNGTYAEKVVIKASEVAHKPASLTHDEAASLPLVGLTAWRSLVTIGKLQPGEKALIQAGSGGVGTFAIQLAKALGAEVATTCSERNVQLCKDLGADHVVNYREAKFDEVLEPQDLVLHALGNDELIRGRKVLKKGGRIMSISAQLPMSVKRWGPTLGLVATGCRIGKFGLATKLVHGKTAKSITRVASSDDLDAITALVEAGKIRPVIDKRFPLEEIADAHRYSESGRARGKIVITVGQG